MTRPKLEARDWKGERVWYVVRGRTVLERTAIPETDRSAAMIVRKKWEAELSAPRRSIAAVSIAEVVKWAIESDPNDPTSGTLAWLHCDIRGAADQLRDRAVGALTQALIDEKIRERWPTRSGDGLVSKRTACNYLGSLVRAIRAFAEAKDLGGVPYVTIPELATSQVWRILDRSDFRSILRACREAPVAPLMCETPRSRGRTSRITSQRASVARLVWIMTGTGSNMALARRLAWTRNETGTRSYVDLETGLLHRLGPDAPTAERLRGVPVKLAPTLLRELTGWRRIARNDLVIPDLPPKDTCRMLLREIGDEIGLCDMSFSVLTDTFAAWSLMGGGTVRSVSISIGIRMSTVQHRLGHFAECFGEEALQAFRERPTSIR